MPSIIAGSSSEDGSLKAGEAAAGPASEHKLGPSPFASAPVPGSGLAGADSGNSQPGQAAAERPSSVGSAPAQVEQLGSSPGGSPSQEGVALPGTGSRGC